MLGAIAGDIIGSVHEYTRTKTMNFSLFTPDSVFTDDTVLTVAIAESILHRLDYGISLKRWAWHYPDAGFGTAFFNWAMGGSMEPYNSWGNGSAMRVSPIAYAFESLDRILLEAEKSAAVTHNHPEGIKGAQAAATAVFLARKGSSKDEIRTYIEKTFGYDLSESVDSLRQHYEYDISCQGTVPAAIRSFLDSYDFEDAIRKAVSLGGDADTLACITGSIAEAHYGGVPSPIAEMVLDTLDDKLRAVTEKFLEKYRCIPRNG